MFLLDHTTHRMLIRYHPRIGHLFVPNLAARVPNETGGYLLRTNRLGFRSDAEFAEERGRRPRILMFGDSYTAGDQCANADRFSDRLAALLDAEVYNYGLSGSGTDQHLLIYREFGRRVQADLIAICVQIDGMRRIQVSHRESIDRITRQRVMVPKPYFTLDDDGRLSLHQVPVPRERPLAGRVEARTNGRAAGGWKERVRDWYRTDPRLADVRAWVRRDLGRVKDEVSRLSGVQPYPEFRSRSSAGWRLMAAILREFIEETRPLPVLIVPIPTYEFFLHGVKPIYQPFFESLADPVRGVSVADVSHPLVALPHATRQRLTFRTGGHFSPFAHELVAGHLADFIRERQLLSRTRGTAAPAGTSDARATPAAASTAGTPTGSGAAGSAGAPTGSGAAGSAGAPTGSAAASTAGAGNGSAPGATPLSTDARVRAASAAGPRAAVHVLGISCFYHNSAAALIRDGEIVAAAEEERFTRVKNDRRFPHLAINYCLEEGGIDPRDLAAVVYYDSAALTFERILHTQYAVGERAREMWTRMLPSWLRYKLHVPRLIRDYLHYEGLVLQDQHHRSHAASAFYPSPFTRAAILTIDGVGEWATASLGRGEDGTVELLREMHFPHSLGLLYSAFTQFTGFKVNSGEYKMMGLAPYGQPRYVREIRDHLVDVKDDGSVELALEYFGFLESFSTTNDRFAALFGGPARQPDARITRREMDIARSIQVVTEEVMLRMARTAHRLTGESKLCLAGGVALNCVANGRLLREGPFDDLWIQPAAGDSGAALGAALDVYHTYFGGPRRPPPAGRPRQGGSYWGPEFSDDEIEAYLETHGYPYRRLDGAARADYLAQCLIDGKVVGHFAGRLEYGPRALGARSILGDARQPGMQAELNLRIKFRESFRPFAPSVLAEDAAEYFDLDRESPYMLLVAPVKEERRTPPPPMPEDQEDMLPIVRQLRSDIPAVTHVDYSARIQTVYRDDHPVYHELIRRFKEKTGCAVIVNTSFNVRGEPIICTPADAYRCFMRTGMNVLALGPFILAKEEQPPWPEGTAEGLESEDATRIEANPHPEKMLAELEEAFRTQCLPVAAALAERGALRVVLAAPRRASAWVDHRAPDSVKGLFEFPPALLETEPDARRFADAIVDLWAPGEAAERSRPLVARLVEIGLRYPPAEDLEEAVSESVYVMF